MENDKWTMVNYITYFLIFLYLLLGLFHPVAGMNQDLGRHLLMGKIIISSKHVPKTNLFSYAYPDFPFINHHWLSEVFFSLLSQVFRIQGLFLFSLFIITTAILALFFVVGKKSNPLALLIVAALTFPTLFQRFDIRPEIFSFFFLSLFIAILYKSKERFTKWIFLLPIMELFWVNMHIYFPIGILVVGLFLIDNIIITFLKTNQESRIKNQGDPLTSYFLLLTSKRTLILFLVLLTCCLATLLNPNGLNGALYPSHVFQNYGYTIEENQSIFFLEQLGYAQPLLPWFIGGIILLLLSLLFSWRKSKPIDWLLTLGFIFVAGSAVRNLPLFVFATIIPFTHSLGRIIDKFLPAQPPSPLKGEGWGEGEKAEVEWDFNRNKIFITKTILVTLLLILMFWQIFSIFSEKSFGLRVGENAKNAGDFYLANHLNGPVFNNFDIGSYLDYRLYPDQKVFVDGRPEAYPASFFKQIYIPMQEDPATFAKVDNTYHFNTIFFNHTDQTPWAEKFLGNIMQNKEWKTVYLDDFVIILMRDSPLNQMVLQKFAMNPANLYISNFQKGDVFSLKELAHFFSVAGLHDQEKQIYLDLLAQDPNNCPVLYNLAAILSEENDAGASIYINRFQQFCKK